MAKTIEEKRKSHNEYMRKWREKNREKTRKYAREYSNKYYWENKERLDQYNKEWHRKHYQEDEKFREKQKARNRTQPYKQIKECQQCGEKFETVWNHPKQKFCSIQCYRKAYFAEYRRKYPERVNAQARAQRRKIRREFCLICLLENKKTIAEDFHHTDYEADLGFSVCRKHHKVVDKWIQKDTNISLLYK